MPTETEPLEEVEVEEETAANVQQEFTCERCGYKYLKVFDKVPFLCNRCMRYLAKKMWIAVHTIQPPNSTPATPSE